MCDFGMILEKLGEVEYMNAYIVLSFDNLRSNLK